MWRLVTDKAATLREIEEHYSIDDLLDHNDALDGISDAQEQANKSR